MLMLASTFYLNCEDYGALLVCTMDDIDYSRIRVIYVLCPCVVGFTLRNVRYIFRRKMALVVINIFIACHDFKTM